ncbi:hypothetical protein ASG90_18745 [Nocardioides sp. Soil797]|nr:hypothetical protein ASG90_18745 [Nocardioides sp. Soil797]
MRFDSEGQFELLGGRSLVEALCGGLSWGEDFEEYAEACRGVGIEIEGNDPDELPIPEVATGPADLHDRIYREKTGYTA